MDAENVLIETLQARANGVHGQCVGTQVHIVGVIGEGEHGSAGVESDAGVPVGEVGGGLLGEVVADGIEVEVPLVAMVSLDEAVEEESPEFGADDCVLEGVDDGGVGAVDVEAAEKVKALAELSEGFVVELVHGGGVQAEVAGDMVVVVASSSKGDLASNSVSS